MTYEEDRELWERVTEAIEELRDLDEKPWSDSKIARWLREEARGFEPYVKKKKPIDIWRVSDKRFNNLSPEGKEKVLKLREEELLFFMKLTKEEQDKYLVMNIPRRLKKELLRNSKIRRRTKDDKPRR